MKEEKTEVRIDKWLWAVRLFKTRTLAVEACKKGRIMILGINIKPSRMVRVGDVIQIRKSPITYSFKVLDLSEKRMGAKLVPEFMEDVTPPSEYEILELSKVSDLLTETEVPDVRPKKTAVFWTILLMIHFLMNGILIRIMNNVMR